MKLNVWITKKTYKNKNAYSLCSFNDECNYVYVCDDVEEAKEMYIKDHQNETLQFNFIHKF